MTKFGAITLGADVGGTDAFRATNQCVLELRGLLASECVGTYSSKIDKYALVLRIDGEIQSWGLRGGSSIRFSERQRMVTTDIYVPSTEWIGASSKLREFLANEVTQAVLAICEKAKARWSDFDSERMIADVARAVSAYRATS